LYSFTPFNRHKTCRYGEMVYNSHDIYIGRSLELYGEYSNSEAEMFRQLVPPGGLVVECGANIGAHTVFFARQVGPQGQVVAFEPQRILFQTLCANLALNSITNVFGMQKAVGARSGAITVPVFDFTVDENFGGLFLGPHQEGEAVPLTRLDDINLPACHFIKIDVEGMELDVIQGGAGTISRHKPVLYVENDRQDKSPALVQAIAALGYKLYWHHAEYFNPHNFFGNPENVFGDIRSHNMVCIHASVPHEMVGLPAVELG
jgi:FkbM family methyltransferase